MEITAKKVLLNQGFFDCNKLAQWEVEKAMIEFAKLHVQEALKQASENVAVKEHCISPYDCQTCKNDICEKPIKYIEQSSILNAYPLENIK